MCQCDTFVADESIVAGKQLANREGILAAKRTAFSAFVPAGHAIPPEPTA